MWSNGTLADALDHLMLEPAADHTVTILLRGRVPPWFMNMKGGLLSTRKAQEKLLGSQKRIRTPESLSKAGLIMSYRGAA